MLFGVIKRTIEFDTGYRRISEVIKTIKLNKDGTILSKTVIY
jgi:hypothetical protein